MNQGIHAFTARWFTIHPVPQEEGNGKDSDDANCFVRISTVRDEVRRLAGTGVCLVGIVPGPDLGTWSSQQSSHENRNKIKFDLDKYGSWWSEAHFMTLLPLHWTVPNETNSRHSANGTVPGGVSRPTLGGRMMALSPS